MNKLNKVINYFKIASGITLITIGIYSEVSILNELSDSDIGFTDGEYTHSYLPNPNFDFPEVSSDTYPINQNYHILIGLGLVAGAILLSTIKNNAEN